MDTSRPPRSTRLRRIVRLCTVGLILAVWGAGAAVIAQEPVSAATQGTGFGTWAPISTYGWHGSMRVGTVHTYCITPDAPAPVGTTVDRGVTGTVAGLTPAELTGINLLVTQYGQTEDPVQAASVSWAIRMIADPVKTAHAFGYPGDDLRGTINWTMSVLAPEHNAAVQDLASAYFAEATRIGAGPLDGAGRVVVSIDPADPLKGTVRVEAQPDHARGELQLRGAVFADSGSPRRGGVAPGDEYAIRAKPPSDGGDFRVSASGTFRAGYTASIHRYTTAGGQDTAGPLGPLRFAVTGKDSRPRSVTFQPRITTRVGDPYPDGGVFEDDVRFTVAEGTWPRSPDGGYLPVTAKGTIYRTDSPPAEDAAVPQAAELLETLTLTTNPAGGPTTTYRVRGTRSLDEPGFYTAVWSIAADDQTAEVARRLPRGFARRERFGEPSQISLVPDVSSRAAESATVGAPASDVVIVRGPVPRDGLEVSARLYRAPEGAPPAESCTTATLVWDGSKRPVRVTAPGEVTITAPAIPDFGTYYWRERATDSSGRVVHEGACGVPSETTRAPLPEVVTRATAEADLGGAATDTAVVSGPIPATGTTTVTFEVYRSDDARPVCTGETRIAETSSAPVAVAGAGEHTSPPVRLEAPGPHHWVESLWWTPVGEQPRLLHRGTCGAENETTVVSTPEVVTRATERAATGAPYTDTAEVTGLARDAHAELMFFVYRGESGRAPVCTADTLETTTAPLTITGSGRYESPPVTSPDAGVRHWVAQLRHTRADGKTEVLHRGACGEAHETTHVDVLPETGAADLLPLVGWGAGGAAATGIALLALQRRRTRHTRSAQ